MKKARLKFPIKGLEMTEQEAWLAIYELEELSYNLLKQSER